jgi:hypothetical protein
VNLTAQRGRIWAPAAITRALREPGGALGVAGQVRVALVRYLVVGFLLLGLVAVLSPHRPGSGPPGGKPWDYQQDTIAIQGGGILNSYARAAVHLTAWLAKSSIERQRDVYRLNLFDFLVGGRTAGGLVDFRLAHRPALQVGTELAIVALVGYGVLRRPSRRTWAVAVLLLLASTVLITKPEATLGVAGNAGVKIPDAMLAVVHARHGSTAGAASGSTGEQGLEQLAGSYWTSFVGEPLSRLQSGTPVLADASPARKPGVLSALRRNISSVNDWAIGRHGPERAFIATAALGYVLPVSVSLGVLAMVAACAQTVLFLLLLAGLFVVPLSLDSPRRRGAAIRYWLLPLVACALLLAAASFASFLVMRVAEALHASDEYIGMLLAGSSWPLLAAAWFARRALRRRRAMAVTAASAAVDGLDLDALDALAALTLDLEPAAAQQPQSGKRRTARAASRRQPRGERGRERPRGTTATGAWNGARAAAAPERRRQGRTRIGTGTGSRT